MLGPPPALLPSACLGPPPAPPAPPPQPTPHAPRPPLNPWLLAPLAHDPRLMDVVSADFKGPRACPGPPPLRPLRPPPFQLRLLPSRNPNPHPARTLPHRPCLSWPPCSRGCGFSADFKGPQCMPGPSRSDPSSSAYSPLTHAPTL